MKNIYHSKPGGRFLRIFSVLLGLSLAFSSAHAAEPEQPELMPQAFEIEENIASDSWIREILAQNAAVYEIIDRDDEGFFLLDPTTGILSLHEDAVIDFETQSTFTLNVRVSNEAGADEAEIIISVINIQAPTALTAGSGDITEKSALLAGSFADNGAATVAAIQYGEAEALDNDFDPATAAGSKSIAAGAGTTALELALDNLEAGTTYYYRTVAKSVEGIVYGEVKSFTTLTIPQVESITIRDQNPTNAEEVNFLVIFSEAVTNVDINDFYLELTPLDPSNGGLSGRISNIEPLGENGYEYVATVSEIVGDGTIKLDFANNGSVKSLQAVSVGGENNGNFTDGEIYTIDQSPPAAYHLIYTNEDVAVRHFFAVTNDPDNPEDLTVTFVSSDTDVIANDGYRITKNNNRWEIRIIPQEHVHGETTIDINVVDGVGNTSADLTLLVVVRAVADAPLLVAEGVDGDEDTEILLNVSAELVDQDGSESLEQIKISGVPVGASLSGGTFTGSGTYTFANAVDLAGISFIPENNISGTYPLILSATSRESAEGDMLTKKTQSASKTFTVTVNAVNDEPVFALEEYNLDEVEDFETTHYIAINPADVPADEQDQQVSYSATPADGQAAIAKVEAEADGNGGYHLKISALPNANGTQVFTITANDGQAANNTFTQDLTINISPVNDQPVFALDPAELELEEDFEETQTVKINAAVVPADERDQEVIYTLEQKDPDQEPIANVSLKEDEEGNPYLEIAAIENANGTQLFTITANDGQAENNTFSREFKLAVTAVNDKPVFALQPSTVEDEEDFEDTHIVKIVPVPVPGDEQDQQVSYSTIQVDPEQEAVASVELLNDDEGNFWFEITSIPNANGRIEIIIRADDRVGGIHEEILTIIINPVNDAPVFSLTETEVIKDEDFEETVVVTITDESPEDEEDQTIVYSISPDPSTVEFANVVFDAEAGKITITAVQDDFGSQVFTITANDGALEHEETLTLTVNPVNDAPEFTLSETEVVRDEDFEDTITITVTEDSPENESDQTITYSLSPESIDFASVVIDATTGKITITSVPNGFGRQEFTVTADDGQEANNLHEEQFTLIVNPVNDAPAFVLSETEVVRDEDFEDTITITVTEDSPGNEEETISYSLVPGSVDFANVSIDEATGEITITSVPNAFGRQDFTVLADDGQGATHPEAFTLIVNPVNDAPVFTLSETEVIKDEDFEETVVVRIADESPESEEDQTIVYSITPDPSTIDFANVVFDAEAGTITITSVPDGFGSQVFVITAYDGQEENHTHTEEFTLIVNPVNDAPVFTLSEEEVIRDEDFTDTIIIEVTEDSPENEEEAVTYSLSPASVDFANVVIDAATGEITITSVPNGFGQQEFTVTADDGQEQNNLHEETFTLIVNPVNDAPEFTLSETEVIRDENFEDTITITVAEDSPENESDQTITYTLVPASVDFANVSIDEATGEITITSVPNGFGRQDFKVIANDGQAENNLHEETFTLIVNPVNNPPVFTLYPEEVIEYEDFTTTETVVPQLSDPVFGEESETIIFSLRNADIDWANVSIDPATGIVTITSVPDGHGERMIEVVATDNGNPEPAEYIQTFLLRVIPVNDTPVLAGALEDQVTNEDELWEYTIPAGIFTDPDGDETLTFTATLLEGEALPAWLSFEAASKTFSGTPDGPDVGDYQILVVATDEDGEQIRDDFKLTVVPVNDVPLISEIDDVTVDLGEEVPPIPFTVSDEETPATELLVTVSTDNEALLPPSAIRLTGEGENRVLELMPPFEEWGQALVTVTVSDGEAEAQAQFTFTVNYQELALDIPDLITPNGDGANDTWNIRYLRLYENNDIRVFDRTGKLVFQARNYGESREWDGTHNGRRLPEGVYYYEIKLNGGTMAKRGTVTIAR